MIKIEANKDKGSLEMRGSIQTVTSELATIFEEIAARHEDIFLAALMLYEAGRGEADD